MNADINKTLLQQLPAIEKLLNTQEILDLQATYARPLVTEALRDAVTDIRNEMLSGESTQLPEQAEYVKRTLQKIAAKTAPRMRSVVNATGTVTHTNLGRSLLSDAACQAIQQAARNYVNLEYDIETGQRGHRDRITEPLLQELTGCEASTVVNNNAAAVLIALQTIAHGKEVLVSRGELIENRRRIPYPRRGWRQAARYSAKSGLPTEPICGITLTLSMKTQGCCSRYIRATIKSSVSLRHQQWKN